MTTQAEAPPPESTDAERYRSGAATATVGLEVTEVDLAVTDVHRPGDDHRVEAPAGGLA